MSTPKHRAYKAEFVAIDIAPGTPPWVVYSFTFSWQAIEDLKENVPPTQRRYDPQAHTWSVLPKWCGKVEEILAYYLPAAEWTWSPVARVFFGLDPEPGPDHYATLCVTRDAPDDLITAAYRILAKLLHPDVGGDTEAMARLNKAFEAVCSERRAGGGRS